MVGHVVTVAGKVASKHRSRRLCLPVSFTRHLSPDVLTLVSIIVILLMLIASLLRVSREAGQTLRGACPYLFAAIIVIAIALGLVRESSRPSLSAPPARDLGSSPAPRRPQRLVAFGAECSRPVKADRQ